MTTLSTIGIKENDSSDNREQHVKENKKQNKRKDCLDDDENIEFSMPQRLKTKLVGTEIHLSNGCLLLWVKRRRTTTTIVIWRRRKVPAT